MHRGQTSFEYLLLIAGVLSVVIIAFAIVRGPLFGASENQVAAGAGTLFNTLGRFGDNADCALLSSPMVLTDQGGNSTISVTYQKLAPAGGTITINCGNGASVNATGCPDATSGTGSCSANCTYATGTRTYAVSARIGELACDSTAVTVGEDVTPPALDGVPAVLLGDSYSTIYFNVTEPANATIRYGTVSGVYTGNLAISAFLQQHPADANHNVTGLTPGTLYYYVIYLCDPSRNCNTTSERSFTTTTPNPPPTVELNSPPTASTHRNGTISFQYTPVDDGGFASATLWGNFSGSWAAVAVNATPISNNSVNTISFTVSGVSNYTWNVRVCDNSSVCSFAPFNFTLETFSAVSVACGDIKNGPAYYTLTADLSCGNPGVRFDSAAAGSIFDCEGHSITSTTNFVGYGIYLNSVQNMTVENCVVSGYERGIYVSGGYNETLTNNTVWNNTYGVYFNPTTWSTLTQSTARNNSYGILFSSSNNNTLYNNTLRNNTNYGIYLLSSSDNNLTSNTIANTTAVANFGVYLDVSSNRNNISGNSLANNSYSPIRGLSTNNTYDNNTLTGGFAYGIWLTGGNSNITNNQITGNGAGDAILVQATNVQVVNNNARLAVHGIYFAPATTGGHNAINNTISNCSYAIRDNNNPNVNIENNTIDYSSTSGIYIDSGSNITIRNNTIYNAGGSWGIVAGGGNNATIENNTVTAGSAGLTYCIHLQMTDSRVTGNTLQRCPTGIYQTSVNNQTLVNNSVLYAATAGIQFVSGSGHLLENNSILHSGTYGIILTITNSSIRGNTIYNTTGYAISGGSTNNTISNNNITRVTANWGAAVQWVGSDSRILNNTVAFSESYGIRILNALNVIIDNNTVYNNKYHGIKLEYGVAMNFTITNNWACNNDLAGGGYADFDTNNVQNTSSGNTCRVNKCYQSAINQNLCLENALGAQNCTNTCP